MLRVYVIHLAACGPNVFAHSFLIVNVVVFMTLLQIENNYLNTISNRKHYTKLSYKFDEMKNKRYCRIKINFKAGGMLRIG